ncbi:MAG: hypothetical protein INF12_14625 [Methylobacterium sp.]|nr:hypothetical protein [Methylobacterium sp.]
MNTLESPLMKADDGNVIQVYWDTKKNEYASSQEGRPVFDKVQIVRVISPGARNQEVLHEAKRVDWRNQEHADPRIAERFGKYIEAFERGNSSPDLQGTPLTAWSRLDVRQIAELRASNVHTIEALANVPDGALGDLGMGARELREAAKRFLEAARGEAPVAKLEAENRDLRDRIAQLESAVEAMKAQTDEPKRGPGRPPKAA